jgi:hypothetical protein
MPGSGEMKNLMPGTPLCPAPGVLHPSDQRLAIAFR